MQDYTEIDVYMQAHGDLIYKRMDYLLYFKTMYLLHNIKRKKK